MMVYNKLWFSPPAKILFLLLQLSDHVFTEIWISAQNLNNLPAETPLARFPVTGKPRSEAVVSTKTI